MLFGIAAYLRDLQGLLEGLMKVGLSGIFLEKAAPLHFIGI